MVLDTGGTRRRRRYSPTIAIDACRNLDRLPSERQGMPLVLLEVLAKGTPQIEVTDILRDRHEVLHGQHGVPVPLPDLSELRLALLSVSGDLDRYWPLLPRSSAWSLGKGGAMKRALIICSPDGYANAVKPAKLSEFFIQHQYDVTMYVTNYLSRSGEQGYRSMLPGPSVSQLQLYCCEALHFLANRQRSSLLKKLGTSLVMQRMIKLRGKILADRVHSKDFDILICENHFDESVVASRIARTQILDLSVPFAEELFYGGELTKRCYESFKTYETEIYRQTDYISFHWHTYAEFVKKSKYNGNNYIDIGYSTPVQKRRAQYTVKPRIIFLGTWEATGLTFRSWKSYLPCTR